MPVASADVAALPKPGFLIGGDKVTEGEGPLYDHRYAATGALTYKVPLASGREIDMAVRAARTAFKSWSRLTPDFRRRHMVKFAELVREAGDSHLAAFGSAAVGLLVKRENVRLLHTDALANKNALHPKVLDAVTEMLAQTGRSG